MGMDIMEIRELFRSKKGIIPITFICLLAFSCKEHKQGHRGIYIPATYILSSSKDISVKNDTVFLTDRKYSGYLYELNAEKDTILIGRYKDGLMSGVFRKWYSGKNLMEERYYLNGQKNGKQTSYWENGNKRFEFTALNDVYEGELKEWNISGNLIHLANFVNGQEEGTQKLWYDNGKIRANFVIRNGKRYGLLGTKNCMNVSDSIFAFK
jgi:hypothetical protein